MKWTDKQLQAITGSGNILVAAAAGSGKTAVLTERIAMLIAEGTDVDNLLVVTFTNAAANEMKKRIQRRLEQLSADEPSEQVQKRLRDCALRVENANISTIHAFCTRVLHRHFDVAGLDPAFSPLQESEAKVMQKAAMEELLDKGFELKCGFSGAEPEIFAKLVDMLGGEEEFSDTVLKLYGFMHAQPQPTQWLDAAFNAYSAAGIEESPWLQVITECGKQALNSVISDYETARRLASEYPKAFTVLDDELTRLRGLRLNTDYERMREAISAMEFGTLRWPKDADKAIQERAKQLRKNARGLFDDKIKPLFMNTAEQEGELLCALRPALNELCCAVKEFINIYGESKARANVIDFSDMEHMALKVLSIPEVAEEYRRRFKYIFVDEYQDSNPVQEAILQRIRSEHSLFLVGDVKQSIYRFRLADPTLFLEKLEHKGGWQGTRVDLSSNFRSSRRIIDTVNCVFERIMCRESGEIEYDAAARLVMGRTCGEGDVEFHIIDKQAEPEAEAEGQDAIIELKDAEAEAAIAAERIRYVMENELYTDPATGESRKYRYSDFAVLLRSARETAALWMQALSIEGIPAYAELTGGYFDALEVMVFLNLLRIIDNRRQDIPLLSVLRSPIGGFSSEELIKLRAASPSGSFFDAFCAASQAGDTLGAKCKALLERLDDWSFDAKLLSVEELIGKLLTETGYYHVVGALPGGRQRQANLDALLERAHSFEARSARSLRSFLSFMDSVANTADMGSAQIGAADVVRIMTVHKSKGLEFPAVIFAGLGRRMNAGMKSPKVIMDSKLGIGMKLIKNNRKHEPLLYKAIEQVSLKKQLAEEMRILYVGMTRARERLIMIGTVRNIVKTAYDLCVPCTPAVSLKATHYTDWLINALLQYADGNPLRRAAGLDIIEGEPNVRLYVHMGKGSRRALDARSRESFKHWIDGASLPEDLKAQLEWTYPYMAAAKTPSKISVSALAQIDVEFVEAPAFAMSGSQLNAADAGTATHQLMQHIRLVPHSADSVRQELKRLTELGIMDEAQAQAVNPYSIARFFGSELGQRLLNSSRVERELPFNCLMPANALLDAGTDELIMLQGVIDCCFLEPDGWVLIDYKTDFVPDEPGAAFNIAHRHSRQVELYSDALARLTGIPVKEKHVFLLRIGESVKL